MSCEFFGNYDWVTGDIDISWVFDESPWWTCIQCENIFYSTVMCVCDQCNPFSGYCRGCHA